MMLENPKSNEPSAHYQTGSTKPPKSNGALVTVLLVAVILLTGITQVLGLLNIRLFRQLQQAKEPSMAALVGALPGSHSIVKAGAASLGLQGMAVDDFSQICYRYPRGLYITQVDADCSAAACGIRPGDILVTLDGIPVTDQQTLTRLMEAYRIGDTVTLVIYRGGSWHTAKILL